MNKPLILVVEDDSSVKNLITTTLKAHDYRHLTAPNGKAAILEASSHNPDIILLDLGLPDMDGVELITRIRSWSSCPILVVSARSEDRDKITALDAGADDYLTKPFSMEELLARLRVAQRKTAEKQRGGIFCFSKWRSYYRLCRGNSGGRWKAGSSDANGVQADLPAYEKRRPRFDAQLYSERAMGSCL